MNSEALPTCLLSACVVWVRRTVGMPHRGVCAPRTHTSSIYVSAAWRLARRHRPPLAHHHLAPKEHYAVALAYLQGAKKCANFQPGKTTEPTSSLQCGGDGNNEGRKTDHPLDVRRRRARHWVGRSSICSLARSHPLPRTTSGATEKESERAELEAEAEAHARRKREAAFVSCRCRRRRLLPSSRERGGRERERRVSLFL